jgi:hypothetical protein
MFNDGLEFIAALTGKVFVVALLKLVELACGN